VLGKVRKLYRLKYKKGGYGKVYLVKKTDCDKIYAMK